MTRWFWIGCVAGLLLLGAASPAQGQSSADAYFHEAARQYVADNVAAARRAVEQGLAVAPTDPRLLALRKKLEQGRRPQGGGRDSSSTGSQQGEQNEENDNSDDASKGGQTPSSEQSGDKQPGSQDDPSSEQDGAQSSSGGAGGKPGDADVRRQGQGGQPVDTLSRAQAERLLRALEGQERRLMRRLRTRSATSREVEKDW
jgi:hypothetical protein